MTEEERLQVQTSSEDLFKFRVERKTCRDARESCFILLCVMVLSRRPSVFWGPGHEEQLRSGLLTGSGTERENLCVFFFFFFLCFSYNKGLSYGANASLLFTSVSVWIFLWIAAFCGYWDLIFGVNIGEKWPTSCDTKCDISTGTEILFITLTNTDKFRLMTIIW